MKKSIIFVCLVALVALVFSSCSSTQQVLVKHDKFVSVEKLCTVPMGSSYEEVVRFFGSTPYEMMSRQKDGYEVYLWKYRVTQREVSDKEYDQKGGESNGNESYVGDLKNVYVLFKNNKLMDMLTNDGYNLSADMVLMTNTIYQAGKDVKTYNMDNMVIKNLSTEVKPAPAVTPDPNAGKKKSKLGFLPF